MAFTISTDIVLVIDIKTENEFTIVLNEKMETLHKETESYVFKIKRVCKFLLLSSFNVNLIIVIIYTNNWTKNLTHPIYVSIRKQPFIKFEHLTD